MRNLITTYLTGAAIARVGILFFVLLADFVFRRFVYGRSDPLSFSLLNYSFLLVVSDSFLQILHVGSPEQTQNSQPLFIAAVVYLAAFFIVYLLALLAHQGYKGAQADKIKDFLDQNLPAETPASVRTALDQLSAAMIEPDVFEKNPNKRRKRIAYLREVKRLANATIDPEQDQRLLLVGKGVDLLWAKVAYVGCLIFALASTLYFFSVR